MSRRTTELYTSLETFPCRCLDYCFVIYHPRSRLGTSTSKYCIIFYLLVTYNVQFVTTLVSCVYRWHGSSLTVFTDEGLYTRNLCFCNHLWHSDISVLSWLRSRLIQVAYVTSLGYLCPKPASFEIFGCIYVTAFCPECLVCHGNLCNIALIWKSQPIP